jgi:hypothetical protein
MHFNDEIDGELIKCGQVSRNSQNYDASITTLRTFRPVTITTPLCLPYMFIKFNIK